MNVNVKDIAVGLASGVILVMLIVDLLGFLAAIAMPKFYAAWIMQNDTVWLGMMGWRFVVEIIPGQILPALILSFLAVRIFANRWALVCGVILLVVLIRFLTAIFLMANEYPNFIQLNGIWLFLPLVIFPVSVFVGGFLASKSLNKPQPPTSGKTHQRDTYALRSSSQNSHFGR